MTTLKALDVTNMPEVREAVRTLESLMVPAEGHHQPLLRDGEATYAFVEVKTAGDRQASEASVWTQDLETLSVGLDPRFQAMIAHAREQARQGLGVPAAEVRRRLGITDEERAEAQRRMEEEEKTAG